MKKGILALALPFAYLACASAVIQQILAERQDEIP